MSIILEKEKLLSQIKDISLLASKSIMEIYKQLDKSDIKIKEDNSPVTEADYLANDIICESLQRLTPDIPIISEESKHTSFELRKKWPKFWLVDPIDGTKEFINQTGEFTVNIALVEEHKPTLGVVSVPASGEVYSGYKNGGASLQDIDGNVKKINVTEMKNNNMKLKDMPLRIAISRHHGEGKRVKEFLAKLPACSIILCGSTLKIGLIAKGEVDIYPRFGTTYAWDTAAGQCILEEAGGKIVNLAGESLEYNTRESLKNPDFIAITNAKNLEELFPINI